MVYCSIPLAHVIQAHVLSVYIHRCPHETLIFQLVICIAHHRQLSQQWSRTPSTGVLQVKLAFSMPSLPQVKAKKPDPAIYNMAAQELSLDPKKCVVLEDSHIGMPSYQEITWSPAFFRMAGCARDQAASVLEL